MTNEPNRPPALYGDGTFMACPLAAGVCAPVKSRWPGADSDQMVQQLFDTGDEILYDHPIGRKLNAYRAVTGPNTAAPDAGTPTGVQLRGLPPNPFNPRVTLRFSLASADRVFAAVFDAGGPRVLLLADEDYAAGISPRRCARGQGPHDPLNGRFGKRQVNRTREIQSANPGFRIN